MSASFGVRASEPHRRARQPVHAVLQHGFLPGSGVDGTGLFGHERIDVVQRAPEIPGKRSDEFVELLVRDTEMVEVACDQYGVSDRA